MIQNITVLKKILKYQFTNLIFATTLYIDNHKIRDYTLIL